MNATLELLNARCSARTYSATPITDADKRAILHSTMRAPTGGNMMMYSIIEVTDQALKDRLAVTCDDQAFIAKAPWVLVFVADMQKWVDLWNHAQVERLQGVEHRIVPEVGDLMSACADALIAAQNAVIAAESLGIGSCYIGDIIEQGEVHAKMFDLPPHAMPVAMLCFGHAASTRPPVPRYEKHVVHENAYRRLSDAELREVSADLDREYGGSGFKPGIAGHVQDVYARKFTADFSFEANRSVAWWLERWGTGGRGGSAGG